MAEIKPLTEGGFRYSLADVLEALYGPARAAERLRGFATCDLLCPTLLPSSFAFFLSEADRLDGNIMDEKTENMYWEHYIRACGGKI